MEIKREKACLEAAASGAGGSTKGNVSQTTLSEPLDLDPSSPTIDIDDVPLNKIYTYLENALPPSPST